MISEITAMAADVHFSETGWIDTAQLRFYPQVRKLCEENTCRSYGTSWACPPAIGTLEECEIRVRGYSKMLLFSKKYALEDSFDFEGMMDGMKDFKNRVDAFSRRLSGRLPEHLLLSNEGCGRCAECTYPNAPCRFPHLLHHSLEGYGFIVSELAVQAGIRYHNGANTVTYFGALLCNL